MQIHSAIIHVIQKSKETSGDESITVRHKSSLLPVDDNLKLLCDNTLDLYRKVGNAYGTLNNESQPHAFPHYLSEHMSSNIDFLKFSNICVDLIADRMKSQQMATTSWPLVVSYANQGRDWLLIAMLKMRESVGLDEETLSLSDVSSFDISDLHEAARIDLNKYRENEQPYLSFVKKPRKGEVTQYFRNALSCSDFTDSKYHTTILIRVFQDYVKKERLEPEKYQEQKEKLYNYCKEKSEKGEAVHIRAISSMLNDEDPDKFYNFIKEQEVSLNDVFSPHKTTFNKLRTYRHKSGSITISFSTDDALDGNIFYNEEDGIVSIKDPSGAIASSIKEAKGDYGIENDET